MRFETYIPCDLLKPYIKSFAISEAVEEAVYKVLPDTGLVIGFQYSGRLSYLHNGKPVQLSASGVTGMLDSYRLFRNTPGTGTLLVFFREGGAFPFFRQPIHELFRESVSLDNFMLHSELMILEEQLTAAQSDLQKIRIAEQFLVSRLRPVSPDKLVLVALELIHKSRGNIRIKDLTEQLHTSQSPLEKRFRQVVGVSPKKFASIVRLKHAVLQYDPQSSYTELGYKAGFYDQAHFIKEFKRFAGETPETFFARDGI